MPQQPTPNLPLLSSLLRACDPEAQEWLMERIIASGSMTGAAKRIGTSLRAVQRFVKLLSSRDQKLIRTWSSPRAKASREAALKRWRREEGDNAMPVTNEGVRLSAQDVALGIGESRPSRSVQTKPSKRYEEQVKRIDKKRLELQRKRGPTVAREWAQREIRRYAWMKKEPPHGTHAEH